ncbi:Ig-like domain-containing protein [Acinetobacter ursingii]|uniref:Ig-like domain-containing protein n=1 Tax=Acinetobacter ursingii TaxID=108980 RepID=UPI00124D205D|nr:Ig-like domain-containing protein [Acinetobacter ursingii]MCU4352877.1 Ig-like domain-containing protein [Acinetobacter ursingii]MDI3239560.1 Ig-like domain-containing protein [Acinetobacter ursingii]
MNKKQLTMKLSAIAVSILLASCGGGGGGYYGDNASGNSSNGGSTTVSTVNVSAISLTDSNGNAVTSISSQGATAQVTVKDGSGKAISGAVVTFTGENMTFGTSNATTLTNAEGVATISVLPTNSTVTGVYALSASASYNNTNSTASTLNIVFSKQDIVIANILAASSTLESGGSTLVSLVTQDSKGDYQNNVAVNFTADCGSFSSSSITSSNQGNVATTYYAFDSNGNLCDGNQKIIATTSTGTSNSTSVSIAQAIATSVVYTTKDAVQLGINSSGSSSSGQIEFTVYSNGTVLKNQNITLSLEKAPTDLSFISLGNRTTQNVKSDSSGKVTVTLYPGNLPGPVEIKASLPNGLSALSKNVTVTTGRATQNSFSLSTSKQSLQTDKDGDTATITAMLADRNSNSVPDGTVVNFVAEGGKVDGSCKTVDGQCSVTLRTQNPRPSNGRVTVLAYVEGDKSYLDKDGDGVYTPVSAGGTDTLVSNIGNFFRDDNENASYDSSTGEFLYKRVASSYSTNTCAVSTVDQPNIAYTCDDQLATTLRKQMIFSFASDTPTFVANSGINGATVSDNFEFQLFGNSMLTVPMPSGTSISVTTKDNTDGNNLSCSAEIISGSNPVPTVLDLMAPSTFSSSSITKYKVQLTGCAASDNILVAVAAPNKTTTFRFTR